MALRYRFDPGRTFRKQVDQWRKDLADLRWAWPAVAHAVEKVHAENFEREGALSERGGWLPLSILTAKARFFGWPIEGSVTAAYSAPSTETEDGRILHWTHRLRDSLAGPRSPDAIREYNRSKMVFGTRAPHATIHHKGGTDPNIGKDIPPRPLLAASASLPPAARAMQAALDLYFRRGHKPVFAASARQLP